MWFENQKYSDFCFQKKYEEKHLNIFERTRYWLDIYFSGRDPNFKLPLHFIGSNFQNDVWEIIYSVPYGKIITYGEIASQIAKKRCLEKMSSRAVGGAVGKNKISIIVPCHRVVGKNGNLTGYSGGIDKKIELLKLEKVNIKSYFVLKN